MNLQPQPEKNVLHFSDLSLNVVQNDLELFLQPYKDSIVVISLDQKSQPSDYQKFLRAKVIFKDSESANKVRLEQNLKKIKGHSVRIMWDERDSSIRYNTKSNLFIKGIPEKTSPREVYEYFMKFGNISSLKIPEDEIGNHHGYGYITYYNPEDAETVISTIKNENEKPFGVKLEVAHFQRKNERNFDFYSSNARSLFIKNFPETFKEENLTKICSEYGQIEKINMFHGPHDNSYCIVTYTTEEETKKALETLGTLSFEGKRLFVQPQQNKYERKQIFEHQMIENSNKLNAMFHLCNLHIRNIPFNATEEDLSKVFSKFGNIKSLKIATYILETNEGGKIKEILTSKGFGYLCYDNQESASKAKEAYNGKYLDGFESWNRPILIDYFMPKQQRMVYANQLNTPNNSNNMNYPFNQIFPYPPIFPGPNPRPRVMPGYRPNPRPYPFNPRPHRPIHKPKITKPAPAPQTRPPLVDENILRSKQTEEEKREYLGEIIFKAIEESPIATQNNMDMQDISKITGMIIGIENLDEVIQTVRSENSLNSRIQEGLNLIRSGGA